MALDSPQTHPRPKRFDWDSADRRLVVRATLANLRREPAHASELVSQLVLGEEAQVLDRSGGWVRVAGRDGYPGWTDVGAFVEASEDGAARLLFWSRRDGVLREGPEPDSSPLWDLVLGARAAEAAVGGERSAGETGSSARAVMLPDGSRAWAHGDGWVAESDLPERFRRTPQSVAQTGLSLRGVPYLWGGTSSKAFDCSGFVQRVFQMHGVPLPRDAWQQAEVGAAIDPSSRDDLKEGDLVFFAEGGGRISHVAIALGERRRIVHSSTRHAAVALDSLDPSDPLYAGQLAESLSCCRRVL